MTSYFFLLFQNLSPYGDRRSHSPGRTSPNVSSPPSPQKLNNSFESTGSSEQYNSMASLDPPQIYVNDKSNSTGHGERVDGRQCALDNKVFAEHFNLDDLSASFRSLYKSVFDQSVNSNTSNASTGGMQRTKGWNIFTHRFLIYHVTKCLTPSDICKLFFNALIHGSLYTCLAISWIQVKINFLYTRKEYTIWNTIISTTTPPATIATPPATPPTITTTTTPSKSTSKTNKPFEYITKYALFSYDKRTN